MWHVQALFGINGYRFATWDDGNQVGWFFLHFPHYHVTEPVSTHPGVEVDVQQISGRGELPNLEIRLCRNGQTIAYSWVLASEHYCLNPEARTIFNTESFGVYEPEDRGKGLGRYLMQLKLWEMRKLGYQTATLLSSRPNYRAQLLYTNTGYRVVDASCAFVKDMEK
ncbi:GNAT family N-acetyltransferase [bacterium]|nr:GNAT family N-acetyltransferase [bacterium]